MARGPELPAKRSYSAHWMAFKKLCPGSLMPVKTFGKLQLFLGQNKMNHKGVKYQYCLSTKSIGVTVLRLSTVTCDAYVLII